MSLPWMPGFTPQMFGMKYKAQQGPVPQMSPPPQPLPMPQQNFPTGGLPNAMGQIAQAYKNRDMQPWSPMNDAAGLINDGQYADPLLRQSAQWSAPDLGFAGWLKGLFK